MKMNGMVVHAKVDQPNAHAFPMPRDQRSSGWPGFTVEGEPVELHVHGVGNCNVRQNRVFLQDDEEIFFNARFVRLLWMHDERTDHSHHFLHGHMRVIEVGSFLAECEFVDKSTAGRDGVLAGTRCAVHLDRNLESVPVHRSWFGEVIVHDDADAIALSDLNRGSRRTAVITPEVNDPPWDDFLLHWLSNQK